MCVFFFLFAFDILQGFLKSFCHPSFSAESVTKSDSGTHIDAASAVVATKEDVEESEEDDEETDEEEEDETSSGSEEEEEDSDLTPAELARLKVIKRISVSS